MVVTNLWPGRRKPAWGTFVANRVDALRRLGHDVDVLAVSDHPSAVRRYAGLAGRVVVPRLSRSTGSTGAFGSPESSESSEHRSSPGSSALGGRRDVDDRPVDFVEAHIAYPTGLFARVLARRLRAPLVLFAHGSDVLRAPLRSKPDRVLCRWLFGADSSQPAGSPSAPLVVANTDYLAAEVQGTLGVNSRRVLVASPGIRYADFAAAAREPADRRTRLLFVGHLIHRKAVDVLLDALATLPDPPTLRVIGDGPERPALTEQARTLGLGYSVEFMGALDQRAVAAAMGDATMLAVPSRQEALGLVALEGMAAGCIPVVSETGGLATTVTDGENGFLARIEDPLSLAEGLERAGRAARDPERFRSLRTAADATARSHDVDAATETATGAITAALDEAGEA